MRYVFASRTSPLIPPLPQQGLLWVVAGLFAIIILLELLTSADFVFSYLYIGPILLVGWRFKRQVAARLTILAISLTIFNLWVPGSHIVTPSTIANRLIAVVALVVTEILSNRNRFYEEAIAQQKAQLQVQEQVSSLREDFISTLTHDLKTPLLGAIETLKAFQQEKFGAVTVTQQSVIATMIRSHQGSLQLVETLLDVYRNDTEGLKLTYNRLNLLELVRQVVDTVTELAANYQVSVQILPQQSNQEGCMVEGDRIQLQRVLSNLLINAINHSPIEGQITISLDTEWVQNRLYQKVTVLDQGPGIHAEELPQLFERFYQGHSNRQAKGSGLGLYLTRQIVEAHGGKIWAENRVPRGAVFGFSIPAHPL